MDIYFCDECGARATDLDIRAGKGMRNGHDTICSACVDQGLAGAWLARVGGSAAAVASAGGRTPLPTASASASLAIADAADPISLARDRARTIPDEDPFIVDEPPPLAPAPSTAPDTDLIPAKPPKRQTASAAQLDGLAAAGGGFARAGRFAEADRSASG